MISSQTILKKIQDLHKQAEGHLERKDQQRALICTAKVDVLIELLQDSKEAL